MMPILWTDIQPNRLVSTARPREAETSYVYLFTTSLLYFGFCSKLILAPIPVAHCLSYFEKLSFACSNVGRKKRLKKIAKEYNVES